MAEKPGLKVKALSGDYRDGAIHKRHKGTPNRPVRDRVFLFRCQTCFGGGKRLISPRPVSPLLLPTSRASESGGGPLGAAHRWVTYCLCQRSDANVLWLCPCLQIIL